MLALVLSPGDAGAGGRELFREGYDLLQAGKASQAVSKFEEGLKDQPNDAQANFYLAEAYRKLGKNATAKMYYEKSLKLDPNSKVAAQARQRLASMNPTPVARAPADGGRYANRGGEVHDSTTGLTWARCSAGQRWSQGLGCTGLVETYTWEQARQQAGNGWRLPTKDELASLVMKGASPAIDTKVFPDMGTHQQWYWSSTPHGATEAWGVQFAQGNVDSISREFANAVRLVRTGK